MDQALLKVNSRLQQVPEYPADADQPVITTANSSSRPIAWFIFSAMPPTEEEVARFAAAHPNLQADLERVTAADNVGLKMLRLRTLAQQHPEVDGTAAATRTGRDQAAALCRRRNRSPF